jgi:hypothetical protein
MKHNANTNCRYKSILIDFKASEKSFVHTELGQIFGKLRQSNSSKIPALRAGITASQLFFSDAFSSTIFLSAINSKNQNVTILTSYLYR